LGTKTVLALDKVACRGLTPDLTVLIDIDLETSLERAQARNRRALRRDRMDEQSVEFHRRVREAYLALAEQHPARFRTIDGRADPAAIEAKIWKAVRAHLNV
jgi:dTMP kinase